MLWTKAASVMLRQMVQDFIYRPMPLVPRGHVLVIFCYTIYTTMFGLIVVLISTVAIAFASYRMGSGACHSDISRRDSERNVSLVVLALGFMFLLCGIMSAMAGSWNPFDGLLSGGAAQQGTAVVL
jgi:hypothetical protein